MKQIHLLCNAHLDPVWQWCRPEGIGEAISTFRVAADFCEKYDSFVFNHNESVLYEWVEKYDPCLFERIKNLVKSGKWHIMGGWYLQPDCTMPSGESFIRQIEIGNKYFMEKFGVKPTTAMNVDPFGHSRGLVQILAKTGYDSYLFMRPNGIIPDRDFIWKGYDGSEVKGHCLWAAYRTPKGQAGGRIEAALGLSGDHNLVLWGIGNHGGGPSKEDLEAVNKVIAEHPEIKIIHSDCKSYFDGVNTENLRVEERSMVHCMVGCYTSMVRIKQMHRNLENKLSIAEKILAVSGMDYDKKEWEQAQKALLFNQFHDILPGSMIKQAEEEAIRLFNFGDEIASRMITDAMFRLCQSQRAANDGEIPVMVFNPHPYPVETDIEVEFMLQEQNRTDNEVTVATVYDCERKALPTQNIKEASNINMDWRKRIIFHATLEPMKLNRFDVGLHIENLPKRAIAPCEQTDTHFIVKTDRLHVKINKITGLIDKYSVDGVDLLGESSAYIGVYRSDEDPWGMMIDGYHDRIGKMTLVDDEKANAFNGCEGEKLSNVRVVENGDVCCKIEATFGFENTIGIMTYTIPKHGKEVGMHLKMHTQDANRVYKLCFETPFNQPTFFGQSVFGREQMLSGEREVVFQKWCGAKEGNKGLYVLNRGTYGGSVREDALQLTLLHTSGYCAHPIPERALVDRDRNLDRVDMGLREFDFALCADSQYIDVASEQFNQQPETLVFFPSGKGNVKTHNVIVQNRNIILSCYKPTDDNCQIVRLYNPCEGECETVVTVDGKNFDVGLQPFEVATYRFDGENLTPCDMISL